ncbi:unannotated protein [freshwater metagenome]|uniref:Unannotated protein n=1 Tax=freshwater metagenome TaxID=449393 RepID=A0A6J6KTP2_9ZZZZ
MPGVVAQDNFSVGANVDEQLHVGAAMWAFRQNCASCVGAYVTGDAWANIEPCVRKFDVEFDRFTAGCLVGCKNERRSAKWGWVDAQQDVVHDRVANHHDFQNLVGGNIGLLSKFYYQQIEGIANGECQLFFATLIHHHVGNSTHQVLAETNLGVHYASAAEHFTASEIAEMPRNRCRTDVDSNSVHCADKAWPCSHDASRFGC